MTYELPGALTLQMQQVVEPALRLPHGRQRVGEAGLLCAWGRIVVKALRQRRPHPYHWAPFIVVGRGGPL